MTSTEAVLTELERDALTELVNIGVSRAAVGLRRMVGEQVLLSVPSIELISQRIAAALVGEREGQELIAVRQGFAGVFSGQAMLIFPQAKSLQLVRAVVGEEMPEDALGEIEQEALAETGNVILNGCLATMANMLRQPLSMSLPEVLRGDGERLFRPAAVAGQDDLVLFLYINFSLLDREIRGYIALIMDLPSLATLRALIQDFITRVMNDDTGHAI
ncbi:chemotaxis protein CheX [Paeniroseomonas aquatica]|uniref:Chemotaxis protein CheX n=1 Tax=Paeniroseomonas aquatica TaxID=373043 RepID=A0ABT8A7B1_9PROT|nr:chemotaxis protein CheX [Paeniroseomonas aquatica]MDN3565581.1 chemotaxis protein CheX [Paeniroseomonas aquatica]